MLSVSRIINTYTALVHDTITRSVYIYLILINGKSFIIAEYTPSNYDIPAPTKYTILPSFHLLRSPPLPQHRSSTVAECGRYVLINTLFNQLLNPLMYSIGLYKVRWKWVWCIRTHFLSVINTWFG